MRSNSILALLASVTSLATATTLCSTDSQCSSGVCFDNKICTDCFAASDCKPNHTCYPVLGSPALGGVCQALPADAEFLTCSKDADCTVGRVCLANGACSCASAGPRPPPAIPALGNYPLDGTPFMIQTSTGCIDYSTGELMSQPCDPSNDRQWFSYSNTTDGQYFLMSGRHILVFFLDAHHYKNPTSPVAAGDTLQAFVRKAPLDASLSLYLAAGGQIQSPGPNALCLENNPSTGLLTFQACNPTLATTSQFFNQYIPVVSAPFQIKFSDSQCVDYTDPTSVNLKPCVSFSSSQLFYFTTLPVGKALTAVGDVNFFTDFTSTDGGDPPIDGDTPGLYPSPITFVTLDNGGQIRLFDESSLCLTPAGAVAPNGSTGLKFVKCSISLPPAASQVFEIYVAAPTSSTSTTSTATSTSSSTASSTASSTSSSSTASSTAATTTTTTTAAATNASLNASASVKASASSATTATAASVNPSASSSAASFETTTAAAIAATTATVPGAGVATTTGGAYGYVAPTVTAVATGRNLYVNGGTAVGVAMGVVGWVFVMAL
ncbi:hypothetical protein HDU98_011213 [Podochytrium sp. JEL0797]|nr:hypothetical protein HDU98_011213 [Podochytrium sp. JEL0797]